MVDLLKGLADYSVVEDNFSKTYWIVKVQHIEGMSPDCVKWIQTIPNYPWATLISKLIWYISSSLLISSPYYIIYSHPKILKPQL